MKNVIYLALSLYLMSSCSVFKQTNEAEDWNLEEYQKMWESHQKVYVYANGDFIVTNEPLTDSKDVVALYLKENKKGGKTGSGKLPEDVVASQLSELLPFNPTDKALRPPCCPVRDRRGVLQYYAFGGNKCPYPCSKPYRRVSGVTGKLNCCPPTFMGYFVLP